MQTIYHEEEGYFSLIERVGSKGRYQRHLLILFYAIWFVTSFLILSLSFILMPPSFACPHPTTAQLCRKWVCEKPEERLEEFMRENEVGSIVNELHACAEESSIANHRMMLFFGVFVGYITFGYFSDNFGRRTAMLLTWAIGLAGILLLCSSRSLDAAAAGLFLAGAGCESNLRVNLAIINEVVDYHLRQVYSIILQSAFGVSGVAIALSYYFLYDWRTVTILFCAFPALVVMIVILTYVEETPGHLSAQGSHQVLSSLRRIAEINGLECKITEEEVERAMAVRMDNDRSKTAESKLTILDLFAYKSLRKTTLYLCLMLFSLASLYIGPNSTLDTFQANLFLLQVVLSLPDCIVYIFAARYIATMERRRAGILYLGLTSLLLIATIIAEPAAGCLTCLETLVQLLLFFLSRCCVSFYYGILFIYIIELYPEQVRNIGFGLVSAAGALGSTLVQKLLSYSKELNHNPLFYLLLFSLVCFLVSFNLPETHGHPLQFEIQQLRKKRINKKYQPSLEESTADLEASGENFNKSELQISIESDRNQQK